MDITQVNHKVIDDLRAWFFAKDRSISLAQNALYYLFAGGQANGAYMAFTFVAETVLTSSTAIITFSAIPQDFRHLILITRARTDRAAEGDNVAIQFNNDSGANYDFQQVFGNSATAGASALRGGTAFNGPAAEGANSRAFNFAPGIVFLLGYSINTSEKTLVVLSAQFGDLSADADMFAFFRVGHWRNKNVITSIILSPQVGANFVSGTRFQLYGIL